MFVLFYSAKQVTSLTEGWVPGLQTPPFIVEAEKVTLYGLRLSCCSHTAICTPATELRAGRVYISYLRPTCCSDTGPVFNPDRRYCQVWSLSLTHIDGQFPCLFISHAFLNYMFACSLFMCLMKAKYQLQCNSKLEMNGILT